MISTSAGDLTEQSSPQMLVATRKKVLKVSFYAPTFENLAVSNLDSYPAADKFEKISKRR